MNFKQYFLTPHYVRCGNLQRGKTQKNQRRVLRSTYLVHKVVSYLNLCRQPGCWAVQSRSAWCYPECSPDVPATDYNAHHNYTEIKLHKNNNDKWSNDLHPFILCTRFHDYVFAVWWSRHFRPISELSDWGGSLNHSENGRHCMQPPDHELKDSHVALCASDGWQRMTVTRNQPHET